MSRKPPLEFDASQFSYMVLDNEDRALFVVYGHAPSKYEAGHLTDLLKEVRAIVGDQIAVRSVVWLPVYLEATTFRVALH